MKYNKNKTIDAGSYRPDHICSHILHLHCVFYVLCSQKHHLASDSIFVYYCSLFVLLLKSILVLVFESGF